MLYSTKSINFRNYSILFFHQWQNFFAGRSLETPESSQ